MAQLEQGLAPFEQIARDIYGQISRGELAAGDRVPSERELRDTWDVSKATVGKAVALLKTWGAIETRVGSGTLVAESAGGVISSARDHSERVRARLPIYATGERSVIYEATVMSTSYVGSAVLQAVGLPTPDPKMPSEATKIIKRARRMYRDDVLHGVCTTWLPWPLIAQQPGSAEVIDRLTSTENLVGGNTTLVVSRLYGQDYTHDAHRVGLRHVPLDVARELGIVPGTPMLWTLTTRYAGEYVIEADEWFRTDDALFG